MDLAEVFLEVLVVSGGGGGGCVVVVDMSYKEIIHMYRQGDVYFIKVQRRPEGCQVAPEERRVVALGEATGHRHEVFGGEVWIDCQGSLYVEADAGTSLQHLTDTDTPTEDHEAINLAPGTYHVRLQRQYEPDGWRYVTD